jgi:hypothetical protein
MGDHPEKTEVVMGEKELLIQEFLGAEELHINVDQTVIITTEDKLELCLNKHLKKAERKTAWLAPGSIFLAVLATLLTTSFKDFILSAEAWKAIFIIVDIATFAWFIIALCLAGNSVGVKDIIEELKLTTGKKNR